MKFLIFVTIISLAVTGVLSNIGHPVDTPDVVAAKIALWHEVERNSQALNADPAYIYEFYHTLFKTHPQYDHSSYRTTLSS